MKNQFFLPMLFIVIILSLESCGTSLSLTEGNLDFLEGQNKLKLVYDYSGMEVATDQKENVYLDSMVKKINMTDSGRGELWRRKWFNDRSDKLHPVFEMELNKYINIVPLSIDSANNDANYTMILKIIYTNPGAMTEDAKDIPKMIVHVIFTEIQHPEKVLAKIEFTEITGSNFTTNGYKTIHSYSGNNNISPSYSSSTKMTRLNSGIRLIQCYRAIGLLLGKYLKNYRKKNYYHQ